MTSLKKAIRDTERLLARENLDATVRQEQERKLKSLNLRVSESASVSKRQVLGEKYRMVKFFEKKKVMRKYTNLLKKFQTEKDSEIGSKLNTLKEQLNYITHFPNDKKYISLFPKESSDVSKTQQSEILHEIMKKVKSGELDDASLKITLDH